jgi:hypothetical protein
MERGTVTVRLESWRREFYALKEADKSGAKENAVRVAWNRLMKEGVPGVAMSKEAAWIEPDEPF